MAGRRVSSCGRLEQPCGMLAVADQLIGRQRGFAEPLCGGRGRGSGVAK